LFEGATLHRMLAVLLCSWLGSAQGQNLSDPDPIGTMLRRSMPPLPADAPPAPTEPRNFEGTWFHRDRLEPVITKTMYGQPVPVNAVAKEIADRRRAAEVSGKPLVNASVQCLPPGQPYQLDLNFPFTIFQSKHEIDFVFEEFHGVWKIRMDASPRLDAARSSAAREYMGESIGHWDGDTLVVETSHYKAPFWISSGGLPVSVDGRLIQRIRKINEDGIALEIITTVDDPTYYTTRWSMVRTFAWRPDKFIFAEYNCEQQVGSPEGYSLYGVSPE